jgi:hypothetical protein
MLRAIVCGSIVLVTAFAATGCAGSSTPLSASTTPTTATPITEPPFTGTLTVNGVKIQSFIVQAAGTVTATIATLDDNPDGTAAVVDLSLGTWNGTACALPPGLDAPAATEGSSVTGSAAGTGSLCVRIGDNGNLKAAVNFTINIVHF